MQASIKEVHDEFMAEFVAKMEEQKGTAEEKKGMLARIMDIDLRSRDSIVRKKPIHLIRQESMRFKSPNQMKDVIRRLTENDEIVAARIKDAKKKVDEKVAQNAEIIAANKFVIKNYADEVAKIDMEVLKKLEELDKHKQDL